MLPQSAALKGADADNREGKGETVRTGPETDTRVATFPRGDAAQAARHKARKG
jgi:hypothetical protein